MGRLGWTVASMAIVGAAAAFADEALDDEGPSFPLAASGAVRVLDLTDAPIVIDEPGRYVLDRNWDVAFDEIGTLVHIVADGVAIDFRGFAIRFGHTGSGVFIDADDVSLRNGSLLGDIDVTALESVGARTTIDRMRIGAWQPLVMAGGGSVRDSALTGRFGSSIGSATVAERNTFSCSVSAGFCLYMRDGSRAFDNRIERGGDGAVRIGGHGNVLARNIFDFAEGPFPVSAVVVRGDRNLLHDNSVLMAPEAASFALFAIGGTSNVVAGNIAERHAVERRGVGIAFERDGNFHGDNRFGGVLEPVRLNGTVQIDWGGTVAY